MRIEAKMYHSNGLEYIVSGSYSKPSSTHINYLSRNVDDNYHFTAEPIFFEPEYRKVSAPKILYKIEQKYSVSYEASHSFAPEIFLNPSRPRARFVDDKNEVKSIVDEVFELMVKEKLPENISINILPFDEFKRTHSRFGSWGNGILGFSINGADKKIFVRENRLDALILVIGHEIGHVLTKTLPNKHDEEAKAFAFSIEWAKIIKKHNIADLGLNIKDELDFQPARNGLHDIAFGFVDFMVKKRRKTMQLHDDLVKGYVSVFDRVY